MTQTTFTYSDSFPAYSDFDPSIECLSLEKAVHGFKDAPRAWRLRLHQILASAKLTQSHADAELYAATRSDTWIMD